VVTAITSSCDNNNLCILSLSVLRYYVLFSHSWHPYFP